MTTVGSVEDYDELRGLPLPPNPGSFDIVLVRQQKASIYPIPLTSPPNGGIFVWDKNTDEADDGGTIIAPGGGDLGRWKRQFEDTLSVKWFGAKGDMQGTNGKYKGTIVESTNKLNAPQPIFTEQDEGKTIVIWKTGTDEMPFITTIDKFVDEKNVQLVDNATKDMLGAYVAWGTDDTDAIQHTINVAKETGYTVYLPPGHFIVTQTLDYVTDFLEERDEGIDNSPFPFPTPYPVMKHGLHMFGAGMQVSFIHNLIETPIIEGVYPSARATIAIDGTGRHKLGSFQQTGYLKDFHITSTGHISETAGIDLLSTWAYTIENVAIMNMGSDGIIIRNRWIDNTTKNSDFDASDKLRLDNVFLFKNDGWAIKVDAAEGGLSTSRIHINRCKIERNKAGGIQWSGQGGTIERSGIYGNGGKDGYGILVKNVKATSNGLLITGCEIQDNANVQVMIAVGANIRIIHNDFKVDDLMTDDYFPSVDIQVGDGNLGDLHIDLTDPNVSKVSIELGDAPDAPERIDLRIDQYAHKIIELIGKRTKNLELIFPVTEEREWLVMNRTESYVKPIGKNVDGSETVLPFLWPNSEKSIHVFKEKVEGGVPKEILVFGVSAPRTVNACVIEDNRIRSSYKGKPAGIGSPDHTVVLVNRNAVGTVIGKWWADQYKQDDKHKLVDVVEINPFTNKRSVNFQTGQIHLKTHIHRDGVDGGHVLLPFASTIVNVVKGTETMDGGPPYYLRLDPLYPYYPNSEDPDPTRNLMFDPDPNKHLMFTPDTSKWSNYRVRVNDPVETLLVDNPTVRTTGTPLFFEFTNISNKSLLVLFKSDYDVGRRIVLYNPDFTVKDTLGGNIIIPSGKTVSGILLFDEGKRWASHSPWTCEGLPHYILASGMGVDPIASSNTIEPTHQIHHITGTMSISKIIPPLGFAGELILIPDGEWKTDTTGNIKNKITAIVDRPVRCIYDNKLHKWFLEWTETVLSSGMGDPIASSNTIEPTHQMHHVTGNMSISTITPPLGFAGELILIPDGEWKTDTTGNIKNKITAIVDRPVRCIYDNKLHKWFLE